MISKKVSKKIIMKAINSDAEISEDLSSTMLPPINRIPATVATPKNSEIGLANSNLLYIDMFCLPCSLYLIFKQIILKYI